MSEDRPIPQTGDGVAAQDSGGSAAVQQPRPMMADRSEDEPETKMNVRTEIIKIITVVVASIIAGFLPLLFPGALDLTPVQHILLVIFTATAFCWITEPIPVYATSLFAMGALAILISDSSFWGLRDYLMEADKAHVISYKSVLSSFSAPVVILFIGGFALAIAATKYKLDINLARILLKPFGKKPAMVTLGIMTVTACFAMFMSNTATTVMMLAMITPVIAVFDKADRGIKAIVFCVPVAANIGGIATPVGTPPNAIALGFLTGADTISFLEWMKVGFPLAVVCVLVGWILLCVLYPIKQKEIEIKIESKFAKDWKSITVYVVFALTILLWMTERWHGINSYVVALIPLIGYTCTGIIKTADIKTMNWDVIWLIAGGIALGDALGKTGLAAKLANIIDYAQYSGLMIVILLSIIGWALSNFISNTASANLMLPIAVAVLTQAGDIGIARPTVLMFCAIAISFAMSLPISTPPNALAYATGYLRNRDIMFAGGIISVVCLGLGILTMWMVG